MSRTERVKKAFRTCVAQIKKNSRGIPTITAERICAAVRRKKKRK